MHLACRRDRGGIAVMLLQRGASMEVTDKVCLYFSHCHAMHLLHSQETKHISHGRFGFAPN